jgi:pyruvate/2-oxoglutarate dehydrogenase complex dihydrolipoamide acyltransferase (E2) component
MEEIFVPAVGMAMENVVLLEWQKKPGDAISVGDVIAIIETDKTTMELTSETSGILGKHRYQVDAEVPAGQTVTVVLAIGESE